MAIPSYWASNTNNNLALPQGSETSTALPSSISSLITNQLYQAGAKPANYWNQFFGGTWYTPAGGETSTSTDPVNGPTSGRYAVGGTVKLKDGKYYTILGYADKVAAIKGKTYTLTGKDGVKYRIQLGPNSGKTAVKAPAPKPAQSSNQDPRNPNNKIFLPNVPSYTRDALMLADAYFSPKRLELAYELEQMDTDMRRLSVNMGRQIDDPILQAKLYKEAMRQTRTLDNEQNVFALQMVDQRRKEEMANRQFYDQLALEADKVRASSQQFFANLNLQRGQVELANQQFYAGLGLQRGQTELANQQFYAQLGLQRGQTEMANQQYYAGLSAQMGQTQMANQQYYAGLGAQMGQTQLANQQFYASR